jgi:DNA uptake protein ComE-like DNA-binding protein
MRLRTVVLAMIVSLAPLLYTSCTACNTKPQSPEQLRKQTAAATATLRDDAKAVAGGVKDGLARSSSDQPLHLNSASKPKIESLPGIDSATADRIVAGRPYSSERQLLEKHIVSRAEYSKIADRITVKK